MPRRSILVLLTLAPSVARANSFDGLGILVGASHATGTADGRPQAGTGQ